MWINWEFYGATAELESAKRCPRFAEDAISLIWNQFQSQTAQPGQVEAACVAPEAARAVAGSNVQSISALESALRGEIGK